MRVEMMSRLSNLEKMRKVREDEKGCRRCCLKCYCERRDRRNFAKQYRVSRILGKGGFGTVYAATRIRDGIQVAVKQVAKNKVVEWDMVSKKCLRI